MNATLKLGRASLTAAIAFASVGALWAEVANAQMFREPFTFGPRNSRASMAVYMHQQGQSNGAGAATAAAGESMALVCAGNGQTSATAAGNIMCVIAGSGANVLIDSNQDSNGNQDANAETNQTAADEIGEILNGDTNG